MTTVIILYLVTTTVGGIVGGAVSGASSVMGGIGRKTAAAAQAAAPAAAQMSDPFGAIERSIRDATGNNDPAALRDAAISAMRAAVTGDATQQQDARDRAAQALSRSQGIPVDEARSRVSAYETQFRQAVDDAKRQAAQAADITAKTVTRTALLAAFALIVGALAAWFGGRAGAVIPTLTSGYLRSRTRES